MTYLNHELQQVYARESDEVITRALEAGSDAYTPEAWLVISQEAHRRGLVPVLPPAPPVTDNLIHGMQEVLVWIGVVLAFALLLSAIWSKMGAHPRFLWER